jgi:tetratricopeptide (TPR) repeat protein
VRVIDAPSAAAVTYSAAIHPNSPPQIVPTSGAKNGPAAPVPDSASGIVALSQWIAAQAHVQVRSATPGALNAFADALAARANNDNAKTESSLKAAVAADPSFLPAQLVAMDFFASRGNDNEALAAAKQVLALAPAHVDAARRVARGSLAGGDVPSALTAYGAVLKSNPNDAEALNAVGRYAFSAGDAERFGTAVSRLSKLTAGDTVIHEPDLLLAAGKYGEAVEKYYDIEVKTPNNPALSLKIGRISVLRHTPEIAKLELEKLEKSDPAYGAPLLKAYMAAEQKSKGDVDAELKTALKGSKPGDDYWTSVAEIRAMLGDAHGTVEALKRAVDRREPTITYVLSDPMFSFIASEGSYQQVRASLTAEQQEIRAALAQIAM